MADEFKEVVENVKKEIATMGSNVKTEFTQINKNFEDLKKLVNDSEKNADVLIKDQISKLTTDITTRQEAVDTKFAEFKTTVETNLAAATKRADDLEVAFKRLGKSDPSLTDKEIAENMKDAKDFQIASLAVKNKGDGGATYNLVKNLKIDMDAYNAYRKAFEGFVRTDERMADPESIKSLQVGIDPDGGYTVTPTMSNRIITRLYEMDPMRQLCAIESISTNAIEWMVDYDEAGAGWEGETTAGAETDTPQLFKKRIPVHVMYAKPRATQTLLEDSGINIENWLSNHVSMKFGRTEAAAFVSGDGIGKARGFLTYGNYDVAGTDQWGRIERINLGAAATLTADGLIDLKYSLIEQYLQRGTFLMNRLTVSQAMQLKNGQGDYIWKPGLREDAQSTLLGLPVRMSTTMPQVAAGALAIAIADWREAYMIVDRLGITIQRDPFTVKPFIEFYTRKRVGGDVVNYQAIKIGVVAV